MPVTVTPVVNVSGTRVGVQVLSTSSLATPVSRAGRGLAARAEPAPLSVSPAPLSVSQAPSQRLNLSVSHPPSTSSNNKQVGL